MGHRCANMAEGGHSVQKEIALGHYCASMVDSPHSAKRVSAVAPKFVCTTGSSRHVKTVVEGAFASTADERHNVVKVPVVVNKYAPQRDVVHEYIISHQKRSFASYILWRLFRTLLW